MWYAKSRAAALRQVLAANVQRERARLKWTQEELASRGGITQTYTSQVESATRAVSIDVLERFACALGLEVDELLRR